MENRKTPKPGSAEYNVTHPQDLNKPEFNSSTDKRTSEELPAIENLNNEKRLHKGKLTDHRAPDANLGNDRDEDEKEREKIIRT